MKKHVSTQIYAARTESSSHDYPDWHLGIAWNEQAPGTSDQIDELATRIADAVRGAYSDDGKGASYACSPSGAYTWCACDVAGAAFNPGWSTFETW